MALPVLSSLNTRNGSWFRGDLQGICRSFYGKALEPPEHNLAGLGQDAWLTKEGARQLHKKVPLAC